ncbi:glycosyltransferase [Vibrio sp. 10N.286.48.B7]|uniref:glycosyltransferase n=1 Tax=Vibrio sp. 10N.286.48.B7 TaxID=1880853 RepID=UPI000C842E5D|nr:glycosyltransferase [Vibrio sp. 10N.286.48.B7]PMH78207.1 hypothetical protein BCU58_10045 [Vibrio sp. 10N.286.48.B7]
MRVLLVLPNLAGGGAERINLDLAYEFKNMGFDVSLALKETKGIFLNEAEREFDIINLNSASNLKLVFDLSCSINRIKPDFVIVSMWGLTAFSAFSKLITRHKYKLLLVEHSSLISQFKNSKLKVRLWLRLSTFIAYRIANHVAGVSLGVARDMQKVALLKRTPKTLYNPVPIIQPKTISTTGNTGCKVVVAAGRLIDAKDYPTLFKAILISSKRVDLKLIILGDGPLLCELKSIVDEYDLNDKIIFKGFVENPRDYFGSADLFVLSSTREGFGNVLVEALGCGTPVVSTDCNYGPSEILRGGEFGKLVPVGDSQALSDAIVWSLSREHDLQKLIDRAKDFTPEVAAKRYLDVLGFIK